MVEEARTRLVKPNVGPYDVLEEGGEKNLEYLIGYLSGMKIGHQIEFNIKGRVRVFELVSDTVTIELTFAQTQTILRFNDVPDVAYVDGGAQTPRAALHPMVKQWCIENLTGNMAHPRVMKVENGGTWGFVWKYYIDFNNDRDAILFKLRWIG